MAYAVVAFIDDNVTSEIPTNWLHKDGNDYMCWWPPQHTKNLKSLIMKRIEPDISTWQLVPIHLENFCQTFVKARKIAEDENYTSAEDLQLGKGFRKKIPSRYISPDDTDTLSDEEDNNNSNKISSVNLQKGCTRKSKKDLHVDTQDTIDTHECNNNEKMEKYVIRKLPEWPSSTGNPTNESTCLVPANEVILLENILTNNTECDNICQPQAAEMQLKSYDNNGNEELTTSIRSIKANTEVLIRMCASLELQVKDMRKNINKRTPNMNASTKRIKNMLPLKDIEEIKNMEVLLQEESLLREYRTFILKIGGHSPRETIRNVLSYIFSNACSIRCSWKGRRQNFAVGKLTLIGVMKEIILDQHTLTERDFDDIAAEWFRFGKQRFHRENKNEDRQN